MKPELSFIEPKSPHPGTELPENGDKLAGLLEISANILERQRAQAAILEARRYLRGTLDALPQPIAILDEQSRVIEVNAAWKCAIGSHPLLCREGENWHDHCQAIPSGLTPQPQILAQSIYDVIAGKKPLLQLDYCINDSLQTRWFTLRMSCFEVKGPPRMVVTHEDITDRKRLEAALMTVQNPR